MYWKGSSSLFSADLTEAYSPACERRTIGPMKLDSAGGNEPDGNEIHAGLHRLTGRWKERPSHDHASAGARYAFIVSIETPGQDQDVDIWTPVPHCRRSHPCRYGPQHPQLGHGRPDRTNAGLLVRLALRVTRKAGHGKQNDRPIARLAYRQDLPSPGCGSCEEPALLAPQRARGRRKPGRWTTGSGPNTSTTR